MSDKWKRGNELGVSDHVPDAGKMVTENIERMNAALAEANKEIERLKVDNKNLCADLADDDTVVKKLAAPFIGDFDGPRPDNERGLGFRGVIEVTEALVAQLTAKDKEIERLKEEQKGYIGCRCQYCGRSPAEVPTLVLIRLNPKGELGQWTCNDCGSPIGPETFGTLQAKDARITSLSAQLETAQANLKEVPPTIPDPPQPENGSL